MEPASTVLPNAEIYSVAPMLEWTTRHYRYFARLLTRRTTLYTEMHVDSTLIHSLQWEAHLRFDPFEQPVICQLGGSNPTTLAEAARRVERTGYAGINLNCGCPSDRVAGKGCFGASLMFTPEVVRDCVAAMRAAVRIPVSVKCRLGADDADSYAELARFISVISESGCDTFVVHARKCILRGFSPKDNRTIPPLRYHWVQRLAADFPGLRIGINGGVTTVDAAEALLALELRPPLDGRPSESALLPAPGPSDADPPAPPPTLVVDDTFIDAESEASRREERTWKQQLRHGGRKGGADAHHKAAPPAAEAATCEEAAAAPSPVKEPSPDPEPAAAHASATPPSSAAAGSFPVYFRCAPGAPAPGSYGASAARARRRALDSVMVGRAAYNDPWHTLADADRRLFGAPANPGLSRREVIAAYLAYAEALPATLPPEERDFAANRPFELLKPLMGLFHGETGGARFRATLGQTCQVLKLPLAECVSRALECVEDAALDARPPTG